MTFSASPNHRRWQKSDRVRNAGLTRCKILSLSLGEKSCQIGILLRVGNAQDGNGNLQIGTFEELRRSRRNSLSITPSKGRQFLFTLSRIWRNPLPTLCSKWRPSWEGFQTALAGWMLVAMLVVIRVIPVMEPKSFWILNFIVWFSAVLDNSIKPHWYLSSAWRTDWEYFVIIYY